MATTWLWGRRDFQVGYGFAVSRLASVESREAFALGFDDRREAVAPGGDPGLAFLPGLHVCPVPALGMGRVHL